jgi:hypothetical protein
VVVPLRLLVVLLEEGVGAVYVLGAGVRLL